MFVIEEKESVVVLPAKATLGAMSGDRVSFPNCVFSKNWIVPCPSSPMNTKWYRFVILLVDE